MVILGLFLALWSNLMVCGFAGAFFIYIASRPKPKQLAVALAAACGFAICSLLLGKPFAGSVTNSVSNAAAFLGLGSLAVMGCGFVWFGARGDTRLLKDALILPVFAGTAALVMSEAADWQSKLCDFNLYAFDCSLGISPGRAVVTMFRMFPWIGAAAVTVYILILLFPPLYHAWSIRRGVKNEIHLLQAFVVAGLCGFVLYQICPAIGPLHSFGSKFPFRLPRLDEITAGIVTGSGPRNAMPSLHTAWALLVWWSARKLGWLARVTASVFVILTLLATLGTGEHYLIDLVVAFPFTMAVEGLCALKRAGRVALPAVGAGFGLTLAWIVFLRSSAVISLTGVTSWCMVAATMAVTLAMHTAFRHKIEVSLEAAPGRQLEKRRAAPRHLVLDSQQGLRTDAPAK
jgi:hypothetical protein